MESIVFRTHLVRLVIVSALCAACAHHPPALEHIDPNTCTWQEQPPEQYLPTYFIRDVPSRPDIPPLVRDSVQLLRQYLQRHCWPAVLKTYVRNYQPKLPAWLIYISKDTVEQGLIANGDTSTALTEQRYVWAFVFSDVALSRIGKETLDAAIRDSIRANTPVRIGASPGGAVQSAADSARLKYLRDTVRQARAAADSAQKTAQRDAALANSAKARAHAHPHDQALARTVRETAARAKASGDAATAATAAAKAIADKLLDVESQTAFDAAAAVAERAFVDAAATQSRVADSALVAVSDTADLRFARRTVMYKRDPVIVSLALGLLKALGVVAPVDSGLADSTQVLKFRQASADSSNPLYVAFSRFGIAENTAAALAISPVPSKQFPTHDTLPRVTGVYTNVSNARRHVLELGGMAAISPGPSIPTYDTTHKVSTQSSRYLFNGYITLYYSPLFFGGLPGKERWQLSSLGVFGGTNVLSGTIGDQLVAGVAVGHLFGDAGLDVGVAFVPTPTLVDSSGKTVAPGTAGAIVRTVRQRRLLIGTDVRF